MLSLRVKKLIMQYYKKKSFDLLFDESNALLKIIIMKKLTLIFVVKLKHAHRRIIILSLVIRITLMLLKIKKSSENEMS